MIAATKVSIPAVDDGDIEARDILLTRLFDKPRELSGRRIILATGLDQLTKLRIDFAGRRDSFCKHTDVFVVHVAVFGSRAADDVVCEHASDVQVFLARNLRPMSRAKQA